MSELLLNEMSEVHPIQKGSRAVQAMGGEMGVRDEYVSIGGKWGEKVFFLEKCCFNAMLIHFVVLTFGNSIHRNLVKLI